MATERGLNLRPLSIFFGGKSSEHDASLRSFANVLLDLNASAHNVVECFYFALDGSIHQINPASDFSFSTFIVTGRRIDFPQVLNYLRMSNAWCVNLIIGRQGEDGVYSALAEYFDLEGSFESVGTSALSMDKLSSGALASSLVKALHIPRTAWLDRACPDEIRQAVSELGTPHLVVKPNDLGASLFVRPFAADDLDSLTQHVSNILEYSSRVVLQEFIQGDEYSCGVIRTRGGPVVLPAAKIEHRGLYDHQAKHTAGHHPGVIFESSPTARLVERVSFRLFEAFRCKFLARFDYITSSAGLHFLEFNSVPGMMRNSLMTQMLRERGLSFADIFEEFMNMENSNKGLNWVLRYNIS